MKKMYKLLVAVAIVNMAALFVVLLPLPDIVPTHAGYNNVVDGMSSKWMVLFMGFIALTIPGVKLSYRQFSKNKTEGKNERVGNIIYLVVFVFLLVTSWMAYAMAASGAQMGEKFELPFDMIIGLPVSVMLVIIGNYMSVVKQNLFLGFRTPWTLMDEVVWHKTHRVGAYAMTASGIIMGICIFIGNSMGNSFGVWGIVASVLLMLGYPMVYSYVLYKKLHGKK